MRVAGARLGVIRQQCPESGEPGQDVRAGSPGLHPRRQSAQDALVRPPVLGMSPPLPQLGADEPGQQLEVLGTVRPERPTPARRPQPQHEVGVEKVAVAIGQVVAREAWPLQLADPTTSDTRRPVPASLGPTQFRRTVAPGTANEDPPLQLVRNGEVVDDADWHGELPARVWYAPPSPVRELPLSSSQVRTPAFQAGDTGSNPVGGTISILDGGRPTDGTGRTASEPFGGRTPEPPSASRSNPSLQGLGDSLPDRRNHSLGLSATVSAGGGACSTTSRTHHRPGGKTVEK